MDEQIKEFLQEHREILVRNQPLELFRLTYWEKFEPSTFNRQKELFSVLSEANILESAEYYVNIMNKFLADINDDVNEMLKMKNLPEIQMERDPTSLGHFFLSGISIDYSNFNYDYNDVHFYTPLYDWLYARKQLPTGRELEVSTPLNGNFPIPLIDIVQNYNKIKTSVSEKIFNNITDAITICSNQIKAKEEASNKLEEFVKQIKQQVTTVCTEQGYDVNLSISRRTHAYYQVIVKIKDLNTSVRVDVTASDLSKPIKTFVDTLLKKIKEKFTLKKQPKMLTLEETLWETMSPILEKYKLSMYSSKSDNKFSITYRFNGDYLPEEQCDELKLELEQAGIKVKNIENGFEWTRYGNRPRVYVRILK